MPSKTESLLDDDISQIIHSAFVPISLLGYHSYDPFDALASPIVRTLSLGIPLLERIWIRILQTQSDKFRRLTGIPQILHPNGISHILSARTILAGLNHIDGDRDLMKKEAEILLSLSTEEKNGIGWGLGFPYTSRFVRSGVRTPNLFTTINCANSLLDYWEVSGDEHFQKKAYDTIPFILNELGSVQDGNTIWFRYYPGQECAVYNVNALVSAFFFRIARIRENEKLTELAIKAVKYVISHQNDNGSWFYAAGDDGKWIDGFHSGYVLEGLIKCYQSYNGSDLDSSLNRGFDFYCNNLFTADDIPKYLNNSMGPIDSQNCAQAIQTLALFVRRNPSALRLLDGVVGQTMRLLSEKDGDGIIFRTRGNSNGAKGLYSLRWSQSPMILALSHVLKVKKEKGKNGIN